MVVTVCALDEVAFIFVAPIVLRAVPYSIYYAISSYDCTGNTLNPSTKIP